MIRISPWRALVPQGTLVERLRAAGAGLAAVYTSTGLGTTIADGKEVRYFDGKPYLLETELSVDYAFIAGHRADRLGNVEFRGANQHFGPSFAKAAQVAIVEVDEVVEPGEIPAERIGLPGIFVAPGFTREEVLALTGIEAATGMPVKAGNP